MNDTTKEYLFILHPILDERAMINKSALKRYQVDGWKIDPHQFGHKPVKTSKNKTAE